MAAKRITRGTFMRPVNAASSLDVFHRIAVCIALSAFASSPASAQNDEFRIGVTLPLTGIVAANGQYELPSVYVGADLVNETGGIGGLKARVIVCDSQSLEQQAVICAKRLTSDDNVNLLLGAGTTPLTMAIRPTAQSAGVPLFSLAGGTVPYSPLQKWVFKGHFGNDDFVPPLFDYIKRKNWKRIAVLHDTGPYGSDVNKQIQKDVSGSGLEIVADEQYSPTDTDMSAQITRIRAAHPDAIINFAPNEQTGAAIAKKIVQLGIGAPILIGPNLQTETFLSLLSEALDNSVFITSKVVLESVPSDDQIASVIGAFRKGFSKRYPKNAPLSLSVVGTDGILLAQQAGKVLGKNVTDGEKLRSQIEQTHDFSGVQGMWTFSPENHGTSLTAGITAARFVGGRWSAE